MKYEICWMDPLAAQERVAFHPRLAASLAAKIPIRELQVPLGRDVQEERYILFLGV